MAYLEKEERQEVIKKRFDNFDFYSRRDLSTGVDIHPMGDYSESALCSALAQFMADFMLFTYPDLNGFSGIDCVKFKVVKK